MAKKVNTTKAKENSGSEERASIADNQEQTSAALENQQSNEEAELSEHEQELNKRIKPSDDVKITDADKADAELIDAAEVDEALLAKLAQHTKLYPDNPVFHYTSDGQMFLDANKREALKHEADIKGEGLQSFAV